MKIFAAAGMAAFLLAASPALAAPVCMPISVFANYWETTGGKIAPPVDASSPETRGKIAERINAIAIYDQVAEAVGASGRPYVVLINGGCFAAAVQVPDVGAGSE